MAAASHATFHYIAREVAGYIYIYIYSEMLRVKLKPLQTISAIGSRLEPIMLLKLSIMLLQIFAYYAPIMLLKNKV